MHFGSDMIALPLLLLGGIDTPDPAPAMAAVSRCDRSAVRAFIRAEPRRRTTCAAAIFAEQRAIASKRAGLTARTAATVGATLDSRQRALDDARALEQSWRVLFDEMRADYIANCTSGGRDADA